MKLTLEQLEVLLECTLEDSKIKRGNPKELVLFEGSEFESKYNFSKISDLVTVEYNVNQILKFNVLNGRVTENIQSYIKQLAEHEKKVCEFASLIDVLLNGIGGEIRKLDKELVFELDVIEDEVVFDYNVGDVRVKVGTKIQDVKMPTWDELFKELIVYADRYTYEEDFSILDVKIEVDKIERDLNLIVENWERVMDNARWEMAKAILKVLPNLTYAERADEVGLEFETGAFRDDELKTNEVDLYILMTDMKNSSNPYKEILTMASNIEFDLTEIENLVENLSYEITPEDFENYLTKLYQTDLAKLKSMLKIAEGLILQ